MQTFDDLGLRFSDDLAAFAGHKLGQAILFALDDLSQVGQAQHPALAVEALQGDASGERVAQRVGLFVRDRGARLNLAARSKGARFRVPDAPFVQCDADRVTDADGILDDLGCALNEPLGRLCLREQAVVVAFSEGRLGAAMDPVSMDRKMIHQFDSLAESFEKLDVPWIFVAADHQLRGRVDVAEHRRVATVFASVVHRVEVAAAAPVLVTDAPQPHTERIGRAVSAALAAQRSVQTGVAVLQPVR